jgi:DNA topoisomerase-1
MPMKRVVFHEITKSAVTDAVNNPRDLDMDLVNAQQARRALDYLVGFTLSPVLWRKVPGSRSAGRVQSVALRLIVDREMEIQAFKAREYWTVGAMLTTPAGQSLEARLTHLDGKRLDKFDLPEAAAAARAKAAVEARAYSATKVERKQVKRSPPPPFTTSTMQQEASRKLGFSASHTMRVAQRLYEGIDIGGETVGLITYMRTDAVTLSNEALTATRSAIEKRYGSDYLPEEARKFRTRAKNAQEAHEAIRPTDPGRLAGDLSLANDERRLYELIWRRTVACQMADARLDQVRVDFTSPDGQVTLRANGSVVAFDGFLTLYTEGRDEADDKDDEKRLPRVDEGAQMGLGAVESKQHFTEPPPRYTEASLVRKMEELGIGRPSTYASIITVLQDRDYVVLDRKRFVPEDRGRLVTAFLESFFDRYVEYDFTARLEDQLDQISNGDLAWKDVLRAFWSAFSVSVEEISDLRVREILDKLNEVLGPHIFAQQEDGGDPRTCPKCDDGQLSLKLGKFGAFVGCSNYPDCRFTRQLDNGEGDGNALADGPKVIGENADGVAVSVRKGPYGFYIQLGEPEGDNKPKRVSLTKGTDPMSVDLEAALGLLSLPRDIGPHPETGDMITAGVGRFGPYVKHGKTYKSLKGDDDVLTVGINRAVSLLAEPSRGRGGAVPIKVLGKHPDDDAEVAIFNGRYGPYIKHNRIFATLPKDSDPESVSLEEALPILAEKAAKKGKKKVPAKKKTAAKKKAPAKKKATKKPAKKATKATATKPAETADESPSDPAGSTVE